MTKKINLGVIFGGQSGEHEVSLSSAHQVIGALDKKKYNIIPIAITKKGDWLIGDKGEKYMSLNRAAAGKESGISEKKSQSLVSAQGDNRGLDNYIEGSTNGQTIDLIIPILHGPYGEDGRLQGMLDMLGLPYVFSGCLAQAIAMHKQKAKLVASDAGLNIIPDMVVEKEEPFSIGIIVNFLIKEFPVPFVVKPMQLGSSVGMSVVKDKSEIKKSLVKALKYGNSLILEKFIKGRELTVSVMGQGSKARALPVVEIKPKVSSWFNYRAKYESGGSKETCPAIIPDNIKNEAQGMAVDVFRAVGCKDLARVDFIWSNSDKKLYFMEINTIPGMTPTSLSPLAAKADGMNFSKFLDRLISYNL